jgi:hypothetical protein
MQSESAWLSSPQATSGRGLYLWRFGTFVPSVGQRRAALEKELVGQRRAALQTELVETSEMRTCEPLTLLPSSHE